LADDILDLGDSAGPGVFVFRLKNKIRQESAAEKQEKARIVSDNSTGIIAR
jgi:hypothetical protein